MVMSTIRFFRPMLYALLAFAVPATSLSAAGFNDTGITSFSDASQNNLSTEPTDYPGQDASHGRDAAVLAGRLTKIGGGTAGFDYTKIANNGTELPVSVGLDSLPGSWACTRDNVTGLTWEVKTSDDGPRDQRWTYTWYNTNAATNGGSAGTANGGTCYTSGRCDTDKYTADVNTAGLCGYHDWRMPTRMELLSIVNYAAVNPSIDLDYFPDTPASGFWSASACAGYSHSRGTSISAMVTPTTAIRIARSRCASCALDSDLSFELFISVGANLGKFCEAKFRVKASAFTYLAGC
ncbi:exported hypothetical protein [Gammaproteobacteria bacterium]